MPWAGWARAGRREPERDAPPLTLTAGLFGLSGVPGACAARRRGINGDRFENRAVPDAVRNGAVVRLFPEGKL